MDAATTLARSFATLPELVALHARERGDKPALIADGGTLDYAGLDRAMDRVAAALQRDGLARGQAVAICGAAGLDYVAVFLGTLRAGGAVAPLAPSATPAQLAAMIADSGADHVFVDTASRQALSDQAIAARLIELGSPEYRAWLAAPGHAPHPAEIAPADPFNIIYSSGTTGTPKGIVQSHAMRWAHIHRNAGAGFGEAVTMVATPLYSNTTLVVFLPTLGWGGTAVVMAKFDARRFLELAQSHRATHTMLVPVQYQRLMAVPDFDRFDLSSFRLKTCTSAPFSAALKAEVVRRWPGLLVEYYGMTEGGGTTMLNCTAHPTKLHTVGVPVEGHDIRLIDESGREVPPGGTGEVVGRSPAMMNGYHRREEATRATEWFDGEGRRFIRHGDLGRFDADGFLVLMDRKKDVIISGGFNIYPSDLEAVLARHPQIAECAVVGVPSADWGETPVGFFVAASPAADPAAILAWANAQLGRTQRLHALRVVSELPRSAIGKVLKRDLRDAWSPA
ncbi:MAG: 4-coumarate--CoA ligase [Proteobacteria bacterium SG_bin6]|nr:MAG: 4-coumarate--CoA ligase [Proteobacteria bacterium SG_bin6]